MAKKQMGDTKKAVSKKTAKKTTAKKSVAKKTATTKKPVAKKYAAKRKSTKSVDVIEVNKQNAPKPNAKQTVLEIADNAVVGKVKEKIKSNIKQTEHWHAGIFALFVIFGAYLSYQFLGQQNYEQPVVTVDDGEVVDETQQPANGDVEIVYDFNFPQDYAWLTLDIGEDVNTTPGGEGVFELRVRNSGEATWYRDADQAFRLATLDPADAQIPFVASSVLEDGSSRPVVNRNRIEMMEKEVAPGEVATFRVQVKATDWRGVELAPGSYPMTVGFLVEGEGSLSKNPLTWLLNVR